MKSGRHPEAQWLKPTLLADPKKDKMQEQNSICAIGTLQAI